MSADDTDDTDRDDPDGVNDDEPLSEGGTSDETSPTENGGDEPADGRSARDELQKHRERLEEEADRAVEGFDQGIIDLLAWVLDTDTRARIYVYLRREPGSTSEEIAEGTGLYPSTVREALAELHDEEKVTRRKRESEGAGNNPYEYRAIAPSELVKGVVEQVQDELNTVFNLDRYVGGPEVEPDEEEEPITISVEEPEDVHTNDDTISGGDVASGTSDAEDEGEGQDAADDETAEE